MLLATQLERVFILKDNGQEIKLPDPEPKWSVESVMNFYAKAVPVTPPALAILYKLAEVFFKIGNIVILVKLPAPIIPIFALPVAFTNGVMPTLFSK